MGERARMNHYAGLKGKASTMGPDEMRRRLEELAPFHHRIELPHGLTTCLDAHVRHDRERTRLDTLLTHLWPRLMRLYGGSLEGKRVLDVACNCGGFSVRAAESGAAEVVGIDSEPHYIEQANFVRESLQLPNLRFEVARIEDVTPEAFGKFDVIFFFGILYHLEDPVGALRRMSAVANDLMIVDTTLLKLPYIERFVRLPLWSMRVVEPIEDDSYDSTTGRWRKRRSCQFYPNASAVEQALTFVGFDSVETLPATAQGLEPRYYRGKRATFLARRDRLPRPVE
jgi:SAM-dependent methyltransferase